MPEVVKCNVGLLGQNAFGLGTEKMKAVNNKPICELFQLFCNALTQRKRSRNANKNKYFTIQPHLFFTLIRM